MDSTESFCGAGRMRERSIWADERGVFTMAEARDEAGLMFNDGDGWREVVRPDESGLGTRTLRGSADGILWALADSVVLRSIDVEVGEFAESYFFETGITDIESSPSGRMFALVEGAPGLITYDGTTWSPESAEPVPFNGLGLSHLAIADDVLVAGGDNGTVLTRVDGVWTTHAVGTIANVSAVWAFAADDIWVAFHGRVDGSETRHPGEFRHFDGETWTNVPWEHGSDLCDGTYVTQFWGVDDELFFSTRTTLGRIVDGVPTVFADWSGEFADNACGPELHIVDMWGRSPTELFLVIRQNPTPEPACETFAIRWDGTEFHRF